MLKRRGVLALVAASVLVGAVLVPAQTMAARTEQPKYTVLKSHETFEVREYASRLVAEVQVSGDARRASTAGFKLLADFIFGNNRAKASIAMTSPVEQSAAKSESIAMTSPVEQKAGAKSGEWTVTFTMPAKYTEQTLPAPVNPRVRVRTLPKEQFAVTRFSGSPSAETVERRKADLVASVRAAGYKVAEVEPRYARYDPPWTLPVLRRNEILVRLEGAGRADKPASE